MLNMDETSVFIDFPVVETYVIIGIKRVKAITAGQEKTRMSAAFTASAACDKLPIRIIVPIATTMCLWIFKFQK